MSSDLDRAEIRALELTLDRVRRERDDLLAELLEARAVAIAILGAMPPALQRKWPNIVARAMALGVSPDTSPAISKARGK